MRQGERQWFQARLRWAVMKEGRGLDHWLEAEHIIQSDSREAAFAEALRIGHSQEYVVVPDRGRARPFEHRLAEVVYLEEKVRNRWPSRYPSGGSRRPSRSASSTNSTPRNGCRSRLSDRKRPGKERIGWSRRGAKSEYQSGPNPVDKRMSS